MRQQQRVALTALAGEVQVRAGGRTFTIRQLGKEELCALFPVLQIFSRSPTVAEILRWSVAYLTVATTVLLEDGHPVAMGELSRLIGLEQMPAIAAEIGRQTQMAALAVPRGSA